MGSLTSRPAVPEYTSPQIVYVQQPYPVYTGGGSPNTGTETGVKPGSSADNTGSEPPASSLNGGESPSSVKSNSDTEIRISSLLQRSRGLSGTIQTGFRGLLSLGDLVPKRKTLLGE